MSLILPQYWDVLYLAKPRLPVQKLTMMILGVIARVLGLPRVYNCPYQQADADPQVSGD